MGIRHARDIIGNLARLSDVLGAVCSRSILERPLAARQSKYDMSLVACDDANITTCRRIRRKIDAPSRRIGRVSIVDLLRCDLCIRRTIINFETVTRDLARNNLAVEVDRVSDYLGSVTCVRSTSSGLLPSSSMISPLWCVGEVTVEAGA